jgi:general stress protein 26
MTELTFAEIEPRFRAITDRIVWCTAATVDRAGRPRSRILHPVWEGARGWIATGRHSHKEKHLSANPTMSLCYWDPEQHQAIIECEVEWVDEQDEKDRIWDLFKHAPPPVGYDPGMLWQGGKEDPGFGVLLLKPWRLSVWSMAAMASGQPEDVWRPAD